MLLLMFQRFLGKHRTHDPAADSEIVEQTVLRIQSGDIKLRNQFIADYQPFVAKSASRFCKRYIDPSRDDEYSIALSAFNEAINKFSADMGKSFLGFADTVIRRRLIDLVRKETRHAGHIPYSSFDAEDEEARDLNPVEIHQAIEHYEKEKTSSERQQEISDLHQQLTAFGISFSELAGISPKHADSRKMIYRIGKRLAEHDGWMSIVMDKKTLPIKELLGQVRVSRKTLERNRKFLIAVALIYRGAYPFLQDYLRIGDASSEGGGENE